MADALYDWPELYDLVAAPDAAMESYYVAAAGGADRNVLELACGTGRLTLPVALSGAAVTGGDISAGMLARAGQRASAAGVTCELVQLDMRDFTLGQSFDTILIAANSLLHLTQTRDLLSLLACAGRHLKPGGQLVFDIFVPSAHLLSQPEGRRQLIGDFVDAGTGSIRVEETIAYDPITQVSQADWYWSRPDTQDFRHTQILMRQIYPQELPLLLERGGFKISQRFGGFDRTPLTSASMRQVVIATQI